MVQKTVPGTSVVFRSSETFSPCRQWRYSVFRSWDHTLPVLSVVGLSPGSIGKEQNEQSMRRCINFAKSWGFGTCWMLNLFALTGDWKALRSVFDPVGPDNDSHIESAFRRSDKILVAWGTGNHPLIPERVGIVRAIAERCGKPTLCLGKTKSGNPKHPLQAIGDLEPVLFEME